MTQFEPEQIPTGDLREYLTRQLREIAANLKGVSYVTLIERHVAPTKPRAGMIVLADGTDWDPGSGAGFYGYYAGAWNKLG